MNAEMRLTSFYRLSTSTASRINAVYRDSMTVIENETLKDLAVKSLPLDCA